MRILVTGASGFLGSKLAEAFLELDHEVALLLRPGSRLDGLQGKLADFEQGRCASDAEINEFVQMISPDVVVHTACSYGRRGETPVQIADTNIRFGMLILQALKQKLGKSTFINAGTVLNPNVNLYALTKHQFAQTGRLVAEQSGQKIRFVNVMLQHMYGPGDDVSKFTTHVLHSCLRNDLELELTAGRQRRDFIYIDDVVSAFCLLACRCNELEPAIDIDVGSGQAPSIREFAEMVKALTGSGTKLCFGARAYRENESMSCCANLDRMKDLGWIPRYDLEAGLRKMITIEKLFV